MNFVIKTIIYDKSSRASGIALNSDLAETRLILFFVSNTCTDMRNMPSEGGELGQDKAAIEQAGMTCNC